MKGFQAIFAHFYNSASLLKWLAIVGLLLFLPAILFPYQEAKNFFFFFGWFLMFGIPFIIVSQTTFWTLIANTRLSMVPGFHMKAGIILLIFTIVVSQFFVFLPGFWSIQIGLKYFTICTLMLGAAAFSSQTYGLSIWLVMALFSFEPVSRVFNAELISYLLFFISLVVWGYGFRYLSTKKRFSNLAINYGAVLSSENIFTADKRRFFPSHKYNARPVHTIIERILERGKRSFVNQVQRSASLIIFLPIIATLLIMFMDGNETLISLSMSNRVVKIYLLMSMMAPILGSAVYSSHVKEFRVIWLRMDGNRINFWSSLERDLGFELLGVAICVLFNFILALFFTDLSLLNCIAYCVMVLGVYLYSVYIGCIAGSNPKSSYGTIALICVPVLCFCIPIILLLEKPAFMLSMQCILFLIVGILRNLAKQRFVAIDWFQANPFRQLSQRLAQSSSKLNQ